MGIWLVPLVLALFTFGTGDFVVAGLLPELAEGLDVSESAVGQLVTVYSLVYALAAPTAVVFTTRLPRRTLVTVSMLLFMGGNLLAAYAPSYSVMLASRVLSAAAAAAVTPLCFSTAGTLPPEQHRGKALGMLSGGIMLSQLVGVPAGTWLGGLLGWQAAFWLVTALGAVVLVTMLTLLPPLQLPPANRFRDRMAPLTSGAVARGLLAMLTLSAGSMMMMTYIAPVMSAAGGVTTNGIALLFLSAGIAGVVAAQLGGALNDALGPLRTVCIGAAVLALSMAALAGAVVWGQAPFWLLIILAVFMALAIGLLNPPLAVWLLGRAGPSSNEVMALNTSATYIGTSAGSVLGGLLLSGFGPTALPVLAVVEMIVVVLLIATARTSAPDSGQQPSAAVEEEVRHASD
ncbi:MFS transporter [Streptomyces oceani]|uniref:Major facilitator superfamily (MFS) profile domain-containing protein n=1 Tax=Streptomyces oceani TaxID=1075402 RepID=A0A1E7JRD9_9ACTN|nr:MFS transporter [Streptomyces oceani]OEU91357.1 hypothetical protein AN216_25340 [Streptomyces oceani]